MARRKPAYQKNKQNYIGMFSVTLVVFTMCVIMLFGMISLSNKKKEYDSKIDLLNSQIEEENKRAEDLEEYEKYTKTSAYVEEVAKERLGLVYEDEIIFQPEE